MKKLPLLILSLILIILVAGCTQTQTPTGQALVQQTTQNTPQVSAKVPENIAVFSGIKEGDLVRLYFGFDDRSPYDGTVSLEILDSANKTVYTNQFAVSSGQYVDYQYMLTGNPIGKVYEWKIPFSNIQKGVSNIGTAILTFTATNGKTLTAEYGLLGIPSYSPDEIKQMYETKYLQTAKNIGKTFTGGNFEVTLIKVGYFTHLQYDTYGSEVTDFRTDIMVKNIGNEKYSFNAYDAAMIVDSMQYDYSYNSDFSGTNIYPHVAKEGYILYKDVPLNISGQVQIITGSAYWISTDYTSSANILYKFNIEL